MGRCIIPSELQFSNCCIFNVPLQPWPRSQLAHIYSANNCFQSWGDFLDIRHYMTILHVPFPPTSPSALQNFTCCPLQTTATNKQSTLTSPLIPLLPCNNPSPPPILALPPPRPATQVELVQLLWLPEKGHLEVYLGLCQGPGQLQNASLPKPS